MSGILDSTAAVALVALGFLLVAAIAAVLSHRAHDVTTRELVVGLVVAVLVPVLGPVGLLVYLLIARTGRSSRRARLRDGVQFQR